LHWGNYLRIGGASPPGRRRRPYPEMSEILIYELYGIFSVDCVIEMIMWNLKTPKYFGIVFLGIGELCIFVFMKKPLKQNA